MPKDKALLKWIRTALLGLYAKPQHKLRNQQQARKPKADKRKKRLRKIAHKSRMVNYQREKN